MSGLWQRLAPRKGNYFQRFALPLFKVASFDIPAGVCGKLEGESVVESSIKGQSKLLYCEERRASPTSANSMERKPLKDWRDPIYRLLGSPDHDVGDIRIGMEVLSNHKIARPPPSSASTRPLPVATTGVNVGNIRAGMEQSSPDHEAAPSPPSSVPTQLQSAVTAGVPSNRRIARPPPSSASTRPLPVATTGVNVGNIRTGMEQSSPDYRAAPTPPPSSAPTQLQPEVTAGVPSNRRVARPPPPSSASTQPLPVSTTGVTLNHESAQSRSPSRQLLPTSFPDRATPAPVPLTNVPLTKPRNQTYQIPAYVAPHDASSRNMPGRAGLFGPELEGSTNKASKPASPPLPSQMQHQKPAQRRMWGWFPTWGSGE